MSVLTGLLNTALDLENNFTINVNVYANRIKKKPIKKPVTKSENPEEDAKTIEEEAKKIQEEEAKSDQDHENTKQTYKLEHLEILDNYRANDDDDTYNTFEDMNDDKYKDLKFASFLVHYILAKPFYNKTTVLLNNLIFDDKHSIIKSFVTDFDIKWEFYGEGELKNSFGIDKSSMEQMKRTYERYFKIKELFDSNEIVKLYNNYSSYIDEFIRIQPFENLKKYLTNLDGIYTGLYSDKSEPVANELKKKITNLIVGELDNFFRGNALEQSKFIYIVRYVSLDNIFFPFIASYSETEFIELKKKISNVPLTFSLPGLFNKQVVEAKKKYETNHDLYLTKINNKLKDIQSKLTIDDYGVAKVLLTNANKLTKELQTSYTRFLQITNIYDETAKDEFKTKLKEHITTLQTLLKKIVEKEAFLKDKEFNGKLKKDHQFTLGIELLTNVQGNEKLKYTPNMTIPSGGGDTIYFTPKRAMHQNVIKNIPPGKSPEYKYVQLTKLPDFNSLLTRLSSGYLLEADTPFEEYSKVYKKKNDELTNSNIEIVLDTLFETGSPFYIGSDRYTSFSYGWENGVEKITKNDKKETYGDEDDSVIKGLTGPTSIQWQNFFGSTGSSGPLSRPPLGSIFGSEVGEVGTIALGVTPSVPAIKTTTTTVPLTHINPSGADSENKEVGTLGTPTPAIKKEDLLTRGTAKVDSSELDEIGLLKTTTTTVPLTHINPSGADSENKEVGTLGTPTTPAIKKEDLLTRGTAKVDSSEFDEIGLLEKTTTTTLPLMHINPSGADSENKEVGTLGIPTPAIKKEDLLTRGTAKVDSSELDEIGLLKKTDNIPAITASGLKTPGFATDIDEKKEVLSLEKTKANVPEITTPVQAPLTRGKSEVDTSELDEIGLLKKTDNIPVITNPLTTSGVKNPGFATDIDEEKEVSLETTTPVQALLTLGTAKADTSELDEIGLLKKTDNIPVITNPLTTSGVNENKEVSLETTKANIPVPDLLTLGTAKADTSEVDEIGLEKRAITNPDLTNPLTTPDSLETTKANIPVITTPVPAPLTRGKSNVDNSEVDEVLGLTKTSQVITTPVPLILDVTPIVDEKNEAIKPVLLVDNSVAEPATTTPIDIATTTIDTTTPQSIDIATTTPPKAIDTGDIKLELLEDKSTNVDRKKNSDYITKLTGTSSPDKKAQAKFLKLLRLEQNMDVNSFNFTSILEEPISVGGQVGGASTLYIDLDQETTLYSQKKNELENEIKKQQEDELALLSKQNEDLNKDESIQEVKWKYFVTVELQLYPGDHIPLSAYASLACSKKSNDIYNIWQNIITKIKNPDSKEKYKKQMLAYVPIIPNNKTIKNKETTESTTKNNTVKVRDPIPENKP